MELSLLSRRAGQIPQTEEQVPSSGAILPQNIIQLTGIQFTCPTVIRNVLLGINVLTKDNGRDQYPSIIVQRHNGNEYDTEWTIYYTTENVSTSGVYNYSLNPPMSVDDGDILGVKIPHNTVITIYTVRPNNNGDNDDEVVLIYPLAGKTRH